MKSVLMVVPLIALSIGFLILPETSSSLDFPPLPPDRPFFGPSLQHTQQQEYSFIAADRLSFTYGPTNDTGAHREYWGVTNSFGPAGDYGHSGPIVGIALTFPTTNEGRYAVQVRNTLNPLRIHYSRAGEGSPWIINGGSIAEIIPPSNSNNMNILSNLSAQWKYISPLLVATNTNYTFRFNCVYSNAFFRVKEF